jgi:23S rRNA (guanosine2251-2'-O)-methyltransferase
MYLTGYSGCPMEVALLLHDIRSAHNVGSMFRTADAAGASSIYLSGVTPTPSDRFGRAQREVAKVALGAEKTLEWHYMKSPGRIVKTLRARGFAIVGVEQDKRAQNYRALRIKRKTLFIFGNEVKGLPESVRKQCDILLEIPMHGKKESLNVAVTAGIILFGCRVI